MKLNVDLIYPIGSIYMNMNSTSPEVLFGGKWQQLKARFLCGVGELDTANSSTFYGATPSGYTIWAGETSGENMHTLSVNEIPAHSHTMNQMLLAGNSGGWDVVGKQGGFWGADNWNTRATNTGGGWSHNNMPPYFAVYMWKRIA